MPDGTLPTVKKGRKFAQVLEGARKVFMADGFEGASVDDIAKTAQVSKATLYSYFPDKRLLFMEVARAECQRQAEGAIATIDMDGPVRDVLHDIALQMVHFLTSDFGLRIFRICVGESDRFPELGQEFYESGPMMVRSRIVDYLTDATLRGDLHIADVPLAADQFAELCKADLFPRIVFNMDRTFSQAEIDRVVDGAVAMFMACYGTNPAKT
ncbi:TetR/AcrR family transcriptional regulator [Loktanella sp. F6476L]|uniref:TetR/AcrR family transcriptional regulator n=1 Tax=Loktanella sp. F6476L TaxID=2926405 RepID=UPI001FF12021|nr:TetR/AcrR family transcriptional regulator [Loktanella sp. F6476L]MCK0121227.1 TetR/AcrR family transcriptional regulator [Loktanella sp. F6476L]UWQ99785.1 TetR/AcrR family transcriptional regulator [Rhodobacteraceae bacterium S2214]